jgi:hypothetical protein
MTTRAPAFLLMVALLAAAGATEAQNPFKDFGRAVRDGAKTGGGAVRDGAKVGGRAIKDGAKEFGHAVKDAWKGGVSGVKSGVTAGG